MLANKLMQQKGQVSCKSAAAKNCRVSSDVVPANICFRLFHFTLNVNSNFAAAKSGHVSSNFAAVKSGLVLVWLNFDASKKGLLSSKPAPGKSGKVSINFAAANLSPVVFV